MRLWLLSEGGRDAGSDGDAISGAVAILVAKVLGSHWKRVIGIGEIETGRLMRFQSAKGFREKVRASIREAHRRGMTCVAIVIDRDSAAGERRLRALDEGRELASSEPLHAQTAVGVAVETVEAWLISDEQALNGALTPTTTIPRQPSPEANPDPRRTFLRLVAQSSSPPDKPYDSVAQLIDIAMLESRCPDGFAAFATELRARCT